MSPSLFNIGDNVIVNEKVRTWRNSNYHMFKYIGRVMTIKEKANKIPGEIVIS